MIIVWWFPLEKVQLFNQVSNLPKNGSNNDNNNYQAFVKISLEKGVINKINCTLVSI